MIWTELQIWSWEIQISPKIGFLSVGHQALNMDEHGLFEFQML
jgi:hypothetical protein